MSESTKSYIVINDEIKDKEALKSIYDNLVKIIDISYKKQQEEINEKGHPMIRIACLPDGIRLSSSSFDYGSMEFGYFPENKNIDEKSNTYKKFKQKTKLIAEARSMYVHLDSSYDFNNFLSENGIDESPNDTKKIISISLGNGGSSKEIIKELSKRINKELDSISYYIPNDSLSNEFEKLTNTKKLKRKIKP